MGSMKLNPNVGVAILVGGHSSRMGTPKECLKTHDQKSFLDHLIFEMEPFSHKYLSLRADQNYKAHGFVNIYDQYENIGPLGAICSLLQNCKTDALLVIACDMPNYNFKIAFNFVQHYRDQDVLVALNQGRKEPLASIYHKRILPLIEANIERKNYKIGAVIEASSYETIKISDPSKYLNLNTPKDYQDYLISLSH